MRQRFDYLEKRGKVTKTLFLKKTQHIKAPEAAVSLQIWTPRPAVPAGAVRAQHSTRDAARPDTCAAPRARTRPA